MAATSHKVTRAMLRITCSKVIQNGTKFFYSTEETAPDPPFGIYPRTPSANVNVI
jgi:hypothetical protein